MPLDTSIPLQLRQIQFDDPQAIRAKGLQLNQLERADADAQRVATERQTIRDLFKSSVGADGRIDSAGLSRGMAAAGLGDQIAETQKGLADSRKAVTGAEDADLNLHKKRLDMLNGGLSALLAKPDVTQQDVIAQINNFVNDGLITPEQGAEAARKVPGRPEQLRPFLIQRALEANDAAKQLDAILPQYNEQDRGGAINEGTVNKLTGERTAGADIAKTPTPGEKLTDARGSKGGPFNQELLAALAARGVSLPTGFRSKEQMLATLNGLIARYPNNTMDEIADAVANGQIVFGGEKKETQTSAAQAGKITYAENEIKLIAPLIREASAKVPRGTFVPWNKLKQYADSQLSDPALKELKSYMTTLSNAYDMLAARGGTDMEKRKHNRELFDTADSPEALEAALKAVENEASISGQAAQKSMLPRSQREGNEQSALKAAPAVGTVQDGYVFQGGDPADQNNWKKR